jgi:hypothetical protein
MKKKIAGIALIIVMVMAPVSMAGVVTIATFADPSGGGANPLFTIDGAGIINGGWDDSKTGLDLNIVYTSTTYNDAWFEMSELTYGGGYGGVTNSGWVKFYKNNAPDTDTPILQIDFSSANLSGGGLASQELLVFTNAEIEITGIDIDLELVDEAFGFAFANHVLTPGNSGFTATAAFTSSGAPIPEPATICMLGLGCLNLIRRKYKT